MINRRDFLIGAAVTTGAAIAAVSGVADGGTADACARVPKPRNRPPQPSALMWGGSGGPAMLEYARPGGLVCVGRENYHRSFVHTLAAGGATVLIYLDPVIDNAYGRYHRLLLSASRFGPAAGVWPGSPRANRYGSLSDFREGSVLQRKFGPVLEAIADENPDISGYFLDDVGTRSWFPGFDFEAWPQTARQEYRRGAVRLMQTAHAVAQRRNMAVFVNGTWAANDGGGFPRQDLHGCSLADGGVIENHGISEIPYFSAYAASPQWAASTPRRTAYMWTINDKDPATRAAYVAAGVPAFAMSQARRDRAEAPWGPIRDFGLPRRGCVRNG